MNTLPPSRGPNPHEIISEAHRRAPIIRNMEDIASPSSAAAWKAYLEIRLENGAPARRVLTESQVVIGRVPAVQLVLDHHTVSRRHAEMVCDPFGRWWIRDLNSTNGTLVNEESV